MDRIKLYCSSINLSYKDLSTASLGKVAIDVLKSSKSESSSFKPKIEYSLPVMIDSLIVNYD